MAKCPNCHSALQISAKACPQCSAIFEGPGAWRPLPENEAETLALRDMNPEIDIDSTAESQGCDQSFPSDTFLFLLPFWTPGIGAGLKYVERLYGVDGELGEVMMLFLCLFAPFASVVPILRVRKTPASKKVGPVLVWYATSLAFMLWLYAVLTE